MDWLQDRGWIVGVIVAAALVVAGLAWWAARRRPGMSVPGAAARRRVDLAFAAAVLITLAVGWGAVVWLVEQADQVTDEKAKAAAKADAVRTGATIALGTGGAAYLLLAYRRQRLEEVDTRERRITELYTTAVEQLGHEKAPVRLGALYSLERLAQNDPEHRQTVIDVYCAYLRMPYSVPAPDEPAATQMVEEVTASPADDKAPRRVLGRDPIQEELQVRQTAQRIVAAHLHLPPGIFRLPRGSSVRLPSVAGPHPGGPFGQASTSTSPVLSSSTSTFSMCRSYKPDSTRRSSRATPGSARRFSRAVSRSGGRKYCTPRTRTSTSDGYGRTDAPSAPTRPIPAVARWSVQRTQRSPSRRSPRPIADRGLVECTGGGYVPWRICSRLMLAGRVTYCSSCRVCGGARLPGRLVV
jgi:hypothetical protein